MKISSIFPIILAALMFVLFFSCKTSKKTASDKMDTMEKFISETIKSNFNDNDSVQVIPNSTNELLLCYTDLKNDTLLLVNQINFIIYDKNQKLVIYQNKFDNAKVNWYNDEQLILIRNLGIKEHVGVENKQVFLINAKSGEMERIEETKSKL
jgi:hypothetical protein